MNTESFILDELFIVHITESVDVTKNPPFLISFRIEVNEDLKVFLNANPLTNFGNVELAYRYKAIGMEAVIGYIANPPNPENKYNLLKKALYDEITFSYEHEYMLKRARKWAIRAFRNKYKYHIDIFKKAVEASKKHKVR